jgi:hypothetical protein
MTQDEVKAKSSPASWCKQATLHWMSPLLAQSKHSNSSRECPLLDKADIS